MTEQKISVARIALSLLGIFVLLVGIQTCRHGNKMGHRHKEVAAEVRRSLPHMFDVDELPASVTDLRCEGVDLTCVRIATATCSLAIDPQDFDALFNKDSFRETSMRRPLSQALDDYIGPDFDVVREFSDGNEEEMWDVTILTNRERDRIAVHVVKDMYSDCD